jgi:ferredoxin-nitrite reductase
LLEEDLLQEFSPSPSAFRRCLVACTGSDYCNLAQIDTKGRAAELAEALEKKMGARRAPLRMHWSGCPAGCGNHEAADIGFRGLKTRIGDKMVEAVAIYVGGRTGPHAAAGQQLVEIAPCDETLPLVVAKLIRHLESGPDPHSAFDRMELTLPAATHEDIGKPQGSAIPDANA